MLAFDGTCLCPGRGFVVGDKIGCVGNLGGVPLQCKRRRVLKGLCKNEGPDLARVDLAQLEVTAGVADPRLDG